LELIQADGFYDSLKTKTERLVQGFSAAAQAARVKLSTNHVCAMFGLFFTDKQVSSFAQATSCDIAGFKKFFHAMLERGVYLAPSAYEAGFVSAAHGEAEIAHTIQAAYDAFEIVARN